VSAQTNLFGDVMDSAKYRLDCGDAVRWLESMPPASLDLLITDPAYESLEKHRRIGTTTRLTFSSASSNAWFEIFPNERFPEFMAAAYRALKGDTHFYLCCDQETMFIAKPAGEAAGFKFWKPLVWDKGRIGMGYHYRARYEFVLFFEKGKRNLNDLGIADILQVPMVLDGYPTQKPVGLSDILIRQSTQPGEIVGDAFMGSGSVGEAALLSGRRFWGNDLSQSAIDNHVVPRLLAASEARA
jgi:site-specific DNA-methyltransferase (adenine-specific)